MVNPRMIPVDLDGTQFAVTWQDFGSYMRLNVFHNEKLLGSKNFPIATDQGEGVVRYAIRSILKGNQNEHSQTVTA